MHALFTEAHQNWNGTTKIGTEPLSKKKGGALVVRPPHLFFSTGLSGEVVSGPRWHRHRFFSLRLPQEVAYFWGSRAPPSHGERRRFQARRQPCFLLASLGIKSTESENLGRNSTEKSARTLTLPLPLTLTLPIVPTLVRSGHKNLPGFDQSEEKNKGEDPNTGAGRKRALRLEPSHQKKKLQGHTGPGCRKKQSYRQHATSFGFIS